MDVFGLALTDFYHQRNPDTLWLHNSYGEPEEMPVAIFFRTEDDMPTLEHYALSRCYGTVLDVGAGVGSHALILEELGHAVTAIDISTGAVAIMRQRGLKNAIESDINLITEKFDTLLFLMNGIGLTGTLKGFENFLLKAKQLINEGGQLLFDSSDISYLYDDLDRPGETYFGEISYCYDYKNVKGEWFKWLYIDQHTLIRIATEIGWRCDIIFEDGEDQYLAKLTLHK